MSTSSKQKLTTKNQQHVNQTTPMIPKFLTPVTVAAALAAAAGNTPAQSTGKPFVLPSPTPPSLLMLYIPPTPTPALAPNLPRVSISGRPGGGQVNVQHNFGKTTVGGGVSGSLNNGITGGQINVAHPVGAGTLGGQVYTSPRDRGGSVNYTMPLGVPPKKK